MAGLADAATDRVSINQAPALGAWSVCAWVKLATNASFSPIVRVEAGGGTAMVFGFKNLTPSLYSASSPAGIVGPGTTLNQYVFVAATRNGTAGALYQGTDPASLTKTTGTVNSAGTPDTWTVFSRSPSDGSEWFSGIIAYLRTWGTTVLTDAEVAAEGAATAPVKAGTWGVWPFGNNGSGGVSLNDTSGNARHLTAGSTLLSLATDPTLTTTWNGALAIGATAAVSLGAFANRAAALPVGVTAQVATSPITTRPASLAVDTTSQLSLGAFADRAAALPVGVTAALVASGTATRAASLPIGLAAAVDLAPLRTTVGALTIAATAAVDLAPVRVTPAALDVSTTAQLDLGPVRTTPGALAVDVTSQLDLVPLADRTAALDATSVASLVLAPVQERAAALTIVTVAQVDVAPVLQRTAALAVDAQASLQLIPGGALPGALAIVATAQLDVTTVRTTPAAFDVAVVAGVVLTSTLEHPAALAIAMQAQVDLVTERQLAAALAIAAVARLLATADSNVDGGSLLLDVGPARDVPWLATGTPEQRLQLELDRVREKLWLIIGPDRPR